MRRGRVSPDLSSPLHLIRVGPIFCLIWETICVSLGFTVMLIALAETNVLTEFEESGEHMAKSASPEKHIEETLDIPAHVPDQKTFDAIIINEVQLLLAEKRTSLAAMRTGITVFVLPLSVISFLIATSRFYDIEKVSVLLFSLLAINAGLVFLGAYLILHAIQKLRKYDRIIKNIKMKYSEISEFMD